MGGGGESGHERCGVLVVSAKGRGSEVIPLENYPTSAWATQRYVEHALRQGHPLLGHLLEPMAGEGAIIRAVNACVPFRPSWTAIEIRGEELPLLFASGVQHAYTLDTFAYLDSLTSEKWFDHTITNPAFSKAFKLLLALWEKSTWITLLLRLNWLEGGKDEMTGRERSEWLRTNMPDVAILPNRPPFSVNQKGKPGTDATSYAWMTWGPHSRGATEGKVTLLQRTPDEVRRAHTAELRARTKKVVTE